MMCDIDDVFDTWLLDANGDSGDDDDDELMMMMMMR